MRKLYELKAHEARNKKFLNIINHSLVERNFDTVINLLKHVGSFTKDNIFQNRIKDLFLTNPKLKEFFGVAENIVGSMSNIVFGGNILLKIDDEEKQKKLNEIYFDGYFIDKVKQAYEYAVTSNDGKSYLFMNTLQVYDNATNIKIKDKFLNFEVFPSFEIEKKGNLLIRTFYEVHEEKTYEFQYIYEVLKDERTTLTIKGFTDEVIKGKKVRKEIENHIVETILDVDKTTEHFDFIPYEELNLGKGMIPNILWIENSLAENLYFQDVDMVNSQTNVYVPENMLFEEVRGPKLRETYEDKYATRKVLAQGSLDEQKIEVVKGQSAISYIERNLAMNVIQACLDAKISPLSLGYSLIDKLASNTDVGIQKERTTIRLRENHINILKIFIAKNLIRYFSLYDIDVTVNDIAVIFDKYITPSIESKTNTLSKQVQFGLKSRKLASRQLNEDELNDNEIEEEYQRIRELSTQKDYNVEQEQQAKKGESNVLKSEK